jgi:glycerophosphoryl diester phosphodiesterase
MNRFYPKWIKSFFSSTRPLAFAHRGGSALAPENTIVAFDRGVDLGADGLELDVRLSRDGVVVVHHDARLERTTDLTGEVAGKTVHELSRADAGFHFLERGEAPFRGRGVSVPTLDDVLRRYPNNRVIIEAKVNTAEMAGALVDVIRRADAIDRVCVGSFGGRVLQHVRRLAPAMATSAAREEVRWALYRSRCRWPVARVSYDGYQVPESAGSTRVVSPRFVADAHGAGLGVQVWTVDDDGDARRLLEWGVDGLITDRPDVVVPIVKGWTQPSRTRPDE